MGGSRKTNLAASISAEVLQQSKLRVLHGKHGTDKFYCRPALKKPVEGVVVFFVGDQLEARDMPERLRDLQDPKRQAVLMSDKWPACNVAVVMPSRVEGCYACFDHFLGQTTASGEPLGFAAGDLKATTQLASLLLDSNLWGLSEAAASGPDSSAVDSPSTTAAVQAPTPVSLVALEPSSESPNHPTANCSQSDAPRGPPPSSGQQVVASAAAKNNDTGHSAPAACGQAARLPVRLVGFSKGGVVLNQFLAELAAYAETASKSSLDCVSPARNPAGVKIASSSVLLDNAASASVCASVSAAPEGRGKQTSPLPFAAGDLKAVPPNGGVGSRGAKHHVLSTAASEASNPQPAAAALLGAVTELHYLDVGLNCRGAYITDPNVANGLGLLVSAGRHTDVALPGRPPKVFLHGTPRQWDDPTRPWLRHEVETSKKLLQAAGLDVTMRKYFANETPSLAMHFDVLHIFTPYADVDM